MSDQEQKEPVVVAEQKESAKVTVAGNPLRAVKTPEKFDIPEEEPIAEKKIDVAKSEEEQKVLDNLEYEDDDASAKESEATYDDLIRQAKETVESEDFQSVNADKMGICVPLSDAEQLADYYSREMAAHKNDLMQILSDVTSDANTIENASRMLSSNLDILTKSIEHVKDLKNLKPYVRNLRDSMASVFKSFDKDRISLSGSTGRMALTTLLGGIRRVRLYNSGFSVNLRNLSLATLNSYYREANTTDFEYGRMFGAYYFMFSDLAITKYIVKNLFPLMICGSSYKYWKDDDRLLKAISFQDFQTILWAAATMMHSDGITVNYTCAEPGCGHITSEKIDLTKLRLLNTDLINDDMFEILSKKGSIEDADVRKYQEVSDFNRVIEFEYPDGSHMKKWKLHLKQASLYDYIQAGDDYIHFLEQECNLHKRDEVQRQTLYNYFRVYKPWIASVEMTVYNSAYNKEQTFTFNNDGSDEMDACMYDMLDQFQERISTEFNKLMSDYIIDTKITHICFYFPKCPACGATPKKSYKGYIPYDVMNGFFTLTLTKLLQAASTPDTKSTSNSETKL